MSFILGIDPGLTGAISFYSSAAPERVGIDDMPVVAGEVDPATLIAIVRRLGPAVAVVERVHAMPKNGSVSGFKLGDSYGAIRATLAALQIPTHFVLPGMWKKHFRLKAGDDGKEHARALALQLFPLTAHHFARKKDHNRAEAALIARWFADVRPSLAEAA